MALGLIKVLIIPIRILVYYIEKKPKGSRHVLTALGRARHLLGAPVVGHARGSGWAIHRHRPSQIDASAVRVGSGTKDSV